MRPAYPSSSFAATVLAAVGGLAARVLEARRQRRVVFKLAALDDRMLRDLGLTRYDVDLALVEPRLVDATRFLAGRAQETRRRQRAFAPEPPAAGARTAGLAKRVA